MNQRRNEPEFDEFEKLLGEIPKVTSGNDYNRFPICLSSSRSSLPIIKKAAQFEEQNLPDDRAFTSAFAEANSNFGIPNRIQENPHLMFIPSYHSPNSSPCGYDKCDSRKLDPLMFRKLQQVGCFPNFSSGISPAQPQHYMPSSQSLSHYPSLDLNWRDIEEGHFQRQILQEEQYLSMNPHCLYLYNNNQSMDIAPTQEHFDYRRAEQSNRNLFWNGEDGDESVRSFDGVRKMCCPEKILMRSQLGLNTAKVTKYGVGDDSQNGRYLLQSQLNEDLTMSLNNLTLQPPKYNSLAEARGKIYYMAKDQHGCRFLQRKFAEKDGNDIEMIFSEIIDYISELMIDPFGNYLVQKLLEVCSDDQRMQIVHSITRKPGVLIKISCDMHG